MSQAEELEPRKSLNRGFLMVLGFWAACGVLVGVFYLCMGYLRTHHGDLNGAMVLTAAFLVCMMALTYGFSRLKPINACADRSPAVRHFRGRQFVALGVYGVLFMGAIWAHLALHLAAPWIWIVAALPGLPLMGMVAAMGFYLREETDEFERTMQVESALWATGGVLTLSSVWGFLEMLGGAPHLDSWVWFPAWSVLLGFANLLTRRRFS